MDYKLSCKNKYDKWWSFGTIKTSPKGFNQASFKVSALKELIELAEGKKSEWVNLTLFDNIPKPANKSDALDKRSEYAPEPTFDLEDEIPF